MMLGRVIGSIVVMAALAACQKALTQTQHRPLPTLAGTEWGFANSNVDQFVAFRSNGEVNGSGGCNNFFGSFTQNGRLMTFGPLASTRRACPEPLMSAERRFLGLLQETRAVEATWREMTLFGDDGRVLAVMQRRDWD
jgi:heat shock protein HslJ